MIDQTSAESALLRLQQSAEEFEDATLAAKLAAYKAKEMEGIVAAELKESGVPITLIPKLVHKDPRCIEAGQDEAKASAFLAGVNARREGWKVEVSFYQSLVKDRF